MISSFSYFLSRSLFEPTDPMTSLFGCSGTLRLKPPPPVILEAGGVILVWLSFFLSGGFMFLEEAKIGSSSILSILLVFPLVNDGLLTFLNIGSSDIISSDAYILNRFLVGLGGLSSLITNLFFSWLFGLGSSKKSKLSLTVLEALLLAVDLLSPKPTTFLLYFSRISSSKSSNSLTLL